MRRPLSPAVLLASLALVLVAGCSVPNPYTPPAAPPAQVQVSSADMTLRVPALGVDQPVSMALGLDDLGAIEVPPVTQPDALGWWIGGVPAGDDGVTVILGHVSGRLLGATSSVPGVFARLDELAPRDTIDVTRPDGRTVTFRVSSVESFPKDNFPTERVYGRTDGPALRLVTCGGTFDAGAHSYLSNIIVWAVAV